MNKYPIMDAAQPSKDLQRIEIFRDDRIKNMKYAAEIYNPVYEKIRIYGSLEDPVFIAKDVQGALELKDMNYKKEGVFEWGRDKIKVKVDTGYGVKDVIALTEMGLTKAIWHSRAEAALNFQTFMVCVMRRLRMTGTVSMDQAVEDYKRENARLNGRLKALDMQMDVEHKQLMHYKYETENLIMTHKDDRMALWRAKQAIENARDPDAYALKDRLDRLMCRTGRAIHIMLCEPPKSDDCEFTYELENYCDGDEDVIDQSEVMIWSIGLQPLKTKVSIKKAYVHKTVKLEQVHDALAKYRLEKSDKKGGHYQNMYEISLEQIDSVIDEVNRRDEKTHSE